MNPVRRVAWTMLVQTSKEILPGGGTNRRWGFRPVPPDSHARRYTDDIRQCIGSTPGSGIVGLRPQRRHMALKLRQLC